MLDDLADMQDADDDPMLEQLIQATQQLNRQSMMPFKMMLSFVIHHPSIVLHHCFVASTCSCVVLLHCRLK